MTKKKIIESIDLSLGLPDDRLVVACGEQKHIKIPSSNYTIQELEEIIKKSQDFFTMMI